MSETTLVTGADGFVGRALVAALRGQGRQVVEHTIADGDLASTIPSYDSLKHVYHLAAKTFVPDSWREPAEFYRVNVQGTVNVLEMCRRQSASVTIVSSYVYGKPQQDPIPETHPLAAFNPYGHSKILAEQAGEYFREAFGLSVSILRPFNLFGPGQASSFLIPSILRQALDPGAQAIAVLDDRPRRDYLYIDDFVSLLLCFADGRSGTFNAGSGVSHSVREVLEMVNRLLLVPKPIVCEGVQRPVEILDMRADISLASRSLGWRPAVSLQEGLRRSFEFLQRAGAG